MGNMSLKPVAKIIGEDFDMDPANRQKLLEGWCQEKISETCVLVAGAGALGNEVIKNLIQIGVGEIYVVDFDHIVVSNLNRCIFFRREDALSKLKKVDVIVKRAREVDPYGYVKVVPFDGDLTKIDYSDELYTKPDIYVSTLDNLYARLYLNMAAIVNNRPLIDGGMEGYIGHVQVVLPGKTACLQCSIGEREMQLLMDKLSCSAQGLEFIGYKIPALPTTTSIIAGIQVQELIKLVLNIGKPLAGKRLFYNGLINAFHVFKLERNPSCIACGNTNTYGKN